MKIHTYENDVVAKGGLISENDFTIAATSKAFKILSSSLYKDKILAIIRELCCNAYDSHVMNGNQDEPFLVKLPTTFNPTFEVRDYGTGLSDEDVMHLYSTYFSSTKISSNDVIGAFGLGSKSPFSYVDTFNVTSVFGGYRRCYTAFINNNGTPSIAKVLTEKSDERTGVEVSMLVQPKDFSSFELRLERALEYFQVKPKVINKSFSFNSYDETVFLEGENWRIISSKRPKSSYTTLNVINTKGIAIQGSVAYPLSDSAFNMTEIERRIINISGLILNVNIGELDVSASREELSYDERTISNIKRYLNQVNNAIVDYCNKVMVRKDNESEWNFKCRIYKFIVETKTDIIQILKLNGNNPVFDVGTKVELNGTYKGTPSGYKIRSYSFHYRKKKVARYEYIKPYIDCYTSLICDNDRVAFIVNDVERGYTKRVDELVGRLSSNSDSLEKVYVIRIEGDVSDRKVIETVLNNLGNPPVKYLSEHTDEPTISKKSKSSCINSKRYLLLNTDYNLKYEDSWNKDLWSNIEVDMSEDKECFYIPVCRNSGSGYINNKSISTPRDFNEKVLSYVYKLGITYAHYPIYGVRSDNIEKVKNNPKWINLYTALEDKINKLNVENFGFYRDNKGCLGSDFISNFGSIISKIGKDCDLFNLLSEKYGIINYNLNDASFRLQYNLLSIYRGYDLEKVENLDGVIDDIVKRIYEKYPLLGYVKTIDDEVIKNELVDYIRSKSG